jgi:two-component system OmpR family response regulator
MVEDSERVLAVLTETLRAAGHAVTPAATRTDALQMLEAARFDLALIDIGLPDGSGLDVCRRARASGLDLPILILTARSRVEDRVAGLDAGADDYLCKPFASAELTARVRALGRRGPRWSESVRRFGAVVIDRDRRTATLAGSKLALTPREFDLVALLAWASGRVVTREQILESVWGSAGEREAASLEVLISRIRRKLRLGAGSEAIRTVRQIGYAWELSPSKFD